MSLRRRFRWVVDRAGQSAEEKDAEQRRELQSYLAIATDENIARGMDPAAARAAAHRKLGNTSLIQEEVYRMNTVVWVETIVRDLRYSLRALVHSKTFAAIAIVSLALGIGANTAAFSLIDAVLLKPLPVRAPDQLRILNYLSPDDAPVNSHSGYNTRDDTGRSISSSISYDAFRAMQARTPEFESVVGFTSAGVVIRATDGTDQAQAQLVSGNYFEGLGVQAVRGRTIVPLDDRSEAPLVAIVTDHFWRQRLNQNPDAIGQTIYVNQIPVTVVGVLPPAFQGLTVGRGQDVFLPLTSIPRIDLTFFDTADPYNWFVQVFARLRPGASEAAAKASLEAVLSAVIDDYAPGKPVPDVILKSGRYGVSELFRRVNLPAIWMLTAAAALVLAICCVNLANLLLGRAAARSREIAVRLSIGASRWSIMRQLLTECCLLAVIGGGLGILIARPLLSMLLRYLGGTSTLTLDAQIDVRTLLFTCAVAAASTLFFGTLPAWRATRIELAPSLKSARGAAGLTARSATSRSLIVVQVALSMLMLTGAGLLMRTFNKLATADLGFKQDHLLTFLTDPARAGYAAEEVPAIYARIRTQLEALPGVTAVGMSHVGLLQGSSTNTRVTVPGNTTPAGRPPTSWIIFGSDSFTQTMGIPLLAGRNLDAHDTEASERAGLVNQEFVRRYFANRDPLGQIFYDGDPNRTEGPARPPIRIVGVVGDALYDSVRAGVHPTAYLAYAQSKWANGMTFEIRTPLDPMSLAAGIRAAVTSVDPQLPIMRMQTQEAQLEQSLGREQLLAWLSTGFAALAAALAAIGLYGVMAYNVSCRTPEFGIRIALGGTRAHVQWLTLRSSALLIAIGLVIGAGAAYLLTQYLASILYGVTARDAASFGAAAALMILVGMLAGWIPARRAARVDPAQTLRSE